MVTCLLDEPTHPPFVVTTGVTPAVTRRSLDALVLSWLDGRDFGEGVPVPKQLVDDSCPPEVFRFLENTSTMWPYV